MVNAVILASMRTGACYPLSFITGAVISLMVVFNTKLGEATTNEVSITVNQIVGIVTLTAIMLLFRKSRTVNPPRASAPWYLWGGGLFGLAVITCNYFSVRGAGTTIAMASAVLGQCLMGMVFDMTGLMGMRRMSIRPRRAAGAAVSFAGILVMLFFSADSPDPVYALIGGAAGIITMIQMVYNSGFAKRKGAFFSARQNVISGLIGILAFSFIVMPEATAAGWGNLAGLSPLVICGGGMLACFVVVASNTIIPEIPASDSSVLMSSGQVLAAAVLDAVLYGMIEPALITGSVIMLLGILLSRQS